MSAPAIAGARDAGAQPRIFCFPHAGGGATSFRPWTSSASRDWAPVAVQLPGRDGRFREPLVRSLHDLADRCVALAPQLTTPYAFFGHSMGALLAYEVACRLARIGRPPRLLVVSAHRAPSVPYPREPLHHLPDDDLVDHLARLGGTPPEVLQDRDLRDLILPILRADLEACETYLPRPAPPLPCPIVAYLGADDPDVPPEHAAPWANVTRGGFAMRTFPGGHFYHRDAPQAVLAALLDDCRSPPQGR